MSFYLPLIPWIEQGGIILLVTLLHALCEDLTILSSRREVFLARPSQDVFLFTSHPMNRPRRYYTSCYITPWLVWGPHHFKFLQRSFCGQLLVIVICLLMSMRFWVRFQVSIVAVAIVLWSERRFSTMGLFQLKARSLFKSDRDYTLHLTKLCFLPASNLYLTKEENSSK